MPGVKFSQYLFRDFNVYARIRYIQSRVESGMIWYHIHFDEFIIQVEIQKLIFEFFCIYELSES